MDANHTNLPRGCRNAGREPCGLGTGRSLSRRPWANAFVPTPPSLWEVLVLVLSGITEGGMEGSRALPSLNLPQARCCFAVCFFNAAVMVPCKPDFLVTRAGHSIHGRCSKVLHESGPSPAPEPPPQELTLSFLSPALLGQLPWGVPDPTQPRVCSLPSPPIRPAHRRWMISANRDHIQLPSKASSGSPFWRVSNQYLALLLRPAVMSCPVSASLKPTSCQALACSPNIYGVPTTCQGLRKYCE